MQGVIRVSHPADLASCDPNANIELALLEQLNEPAMFSACVDAYKRKAAEGTSGGTGDIDISPLARAWREGLKRAPPLRNLFFDLSLPVLSGELGKYKLSWKHYCGRAKGNVLLSRLHLKRLVGTLATITSMRCGGHAHFDFLISQSVPNNEEERDFYDQLREIVDGLSQIPLQKLEKDLCAMGLDH